MQRYVDAEVLPGVSYAVLEGRTLVDLQCVAWADREHQTPLRVDHLFRAFSNTKLVTSCAVLLLMEDGRLGLDDPIGESIPQLAHMRVLKPGATTLDDTEPARGPITVRHLLTHSAGLSYGLLDPGSLMYKAYAERRVLNSGTTLSAMMDVLAELPLLFHPGTSWEYSVASDVLARLVEVASGQRFDAFLQERIFAPLGMADTGFVVPESERGRLTAYYRGADPVNPMKPGLTRIDRSPYPGAYLNEVPRLSGGGGLVSSLPDMVALLRSLLPGGTTLLRPDTIALAMRNHLADDVTLRFASGSLAGKVHGLLGAITTAPSAKEPASSAGEMQWGGIAGTHWWIAPQAGLAAVVMTQRQMAFWHPFAFDFKRQVYLAAGRRL
jgi:CubicO group peptidase (beta-lactamase class C family)